MAALSSSACAAVCRQDLSNANTNVSALASFRASSLQLLSRAPAPFPSRKCHVAASATGRLVTRATAAQPALAGLPMLPHVNWSARAIKAFGMAELEARKLKYPTTGSEALLMGILTEGTSVGARFLRSKGIKLMDLREETVKLLGKADMYYFSAEHPPLTPQADAALKWAIDEHQRLGGQGEVSTELIILGIWAQKESGAGHRLLSTLGFNDQYAQELKELVTS